MKCTICGKQAPSGARLCTPCRAALRRARKATVSHWQPLRRLTQDMRARRAQRKSAKASPPSAAPRPGRKRPSRLGRQEVVMFVALSVVACAMGLLAIRLLDDDTVGRPAANVHAPPVAPRPAAAAPAAEVGSTPPASIAAPERVPDSAPPAAVGPAKPATPKLGPGMWPMEDAADRRETTQVASVPSDSFGILSERA